MRLVNKKWVFLIAFFLLSAITFAAAKTPASAQRAFPLDKLKRETIKIGHHSLSVWIMDTEPKREEGMMFLTEADVHHNEGMLFVFDQQQFLQFWMKNTQLPLDIVFIDKELRIVNIASMKPFDETPVPSNGNAKYALEVKHGALDRWHLRPSMKVMFSFVLH